MPARYSGVIQMTKEQQKNATPEQLVEGNLKLAVFFAHQFAMGDISKVDDLMQEAAIGLHIASQRFDTSKGASFGTYASFWIKQRIQRFLQDNNTVIRVPNHQFDTSKDGKRKRKFTQQALNALYGVFSIHEKREEDDNEFEITDESVDDPHLKTSTLEYNMLIDQLMKTALSERERYILTERFNLEGKYDKVPTLDELGVHFNLTRERVRQIERKALRKLRAKLELESNK